MKKILCLVMALAIAVSCSTAAFATSIGTALSTNEKLKAMGVPSEIIAKMPELMKEDMASHYELNAKFGGSDETIVFVPDETHGNERDISSSQLSLWITYLTLPSDNDGTAHRKVYANFEWLTPTATGLKDVFGVLWGNGWCLSDEYNPVLTYQYYGAESDEIYTEFFPISSDNSTSAPNQGLTYNELSLRATVKNGNETAVDHSGWLTLELERQGGAMSTNIVASYSKAKISLVPTLSVDINSFSVSITPEINYHNELQSAPNYIMY